LGEAFLGEIGRGLGRPPAGISRDARTLLMEYHWPGNVRELRNILERRSRTRAQRRPARPPSASSKPWSAR